MNLEGTIKVLQKRSTTRRIEGYSGDANELDFRRHVLLLLKSIHIDTIQEIKALNRRIKANNVLLRNQQKELSNSPQGNSVSFKPADNINTIMLQDNHNNTDCDCKMQVGGSGKLCKDCEGKK